MLINGTLANRANAGFEPTPPRYAQLIAQHILAFTPQQLRTSEVYTVLEPCIGVGDLALGGRLEYQMLKQVTETCVAGGVLVTIVPARSGWDNPTIAYVGKHYER